MILYNILVFSFWNEWPKTFVFFMIFYYFRWTYACKYSIFSGFILFFSIKILFSHLCPLIIQSLDTPWRDLSWTHALLTLNCLLKMKTCKVILKVIGWVCVWVCEAHIYLSKHANNSQCACGILYFMIAPFFCPSISCLITLFISSVLAAVSTMECLCSLEMKSKHMKASSSVESHNLRGGAKKKSAKWKNLVWVYSQAKALKIDLKNAD